MQKKYLCIKSCVKSHLCWSLWMAQQKDNGQQTDNITTDIATYLLMGKLFWAIIIYCVHGAWTKYKEIQSTFFFIGWFDHFYHPACIAKRPDHHNCQTVLRGRVMKIAQQIFAEMTGREIFFYETETKRDTTQFWPVQWRHWLRLFWWQFWS